MICMPMCFLLFLKANEDEQITAHFFAVDKSLSVQNSGTQNHKSNTKVIAVLLCYLGFWDPEPACQLNSCSFRLLPLVTTQKVKLQAGD